MIEKYKCQNGVRVILENVPAVRSVTMGIWVLTGSRNETTQNNGISHFLEHMFFKGTKTRTAQDIAEAFDSIGGYVNAFTSKEYTCYYAKVLDSHTEYALDILADMFFNSSFNSEEMEKEKGVILEEIKMSEDTPDDMIHDLLASATYGNHPLGYPILGTERHLNTFTEETLHNYINERYIPENIVISVAGHVDSSFKEKIDACFGSFQSNARQQMAFAKPSLLSDTMTRHRETEQAHLCLGFNGLPIDDENMYSLILLDNILGGSMSSRLFQEVREKEGLAYSVFSYHSSFLDTGLLTIYAGTDKKQLGPLRSTINQVIDSLFKKGITDRELHNNKEQLKGNLTMSLESTNSHMSHNGRNELLLKKHKTMDEMLTAIDEITHQSVNQMIDYIFRNEPSVALIAPEESFALVR